MFVGELTARSVREYGFQALFHLQYVESARIWRPSAERIEQARMSAFINYLRTGRGVDVADYDTLYLFSIEKPDEFWAAVWSFCGVIGERRGQTVQAADKMPGAVFFPESRLNFAENLLRRRDDSPAIIFQGEQDHAGTVSCKSSIRTCHVSCRRSALRASSRAIA